MLRVITLLSVLALVASSAHPRHHAFPKKTLSAETSRLPPEVVPLSYVLALRLEEDFNVTNTFSGTVTITLNITEQVSVIQFHAKDLELTSQSLMQDTTEINSTFSEANPVTDFVTVTPTTPLEAGENYKLVIAYNGILSETSMVGFYKSTYVDEFGHTKFLATTQFENSHARTAFPCFDEPEMKATFAASITYPRGYTPLSNTNVLGSPSKDPTNENLFNVRFTTTPVMSTYLLAFVVSEFHCMGGDPDINNTPIQLCSKATYQDHSTNLALVTAPKILNRMSTYTGYNYSDSKIGKLTLAAIPDFAPGAMENWGLVTFKEADLLWDENESSNYYKQTVVTVVAHELSHQWFGDLVTLDWWSDLFLNEGMASYFEYHAPDADWSDWELPKQFVVEELQSALLDDSWNDCLPLSYDVTDPNYSSRTNDVSYTKGGSIFRMIHHFLGIDYFKSGLTDYINDPDNLFSSVTPDKLWTAFETYAQLLPGEQKLPDTMNMVMENWAKKPGYPLLTVTANGDDIIISQEQFLLSGDGDGTKWYVPISYTLSTDTANFGNTATKAWLTPASDLTLIGIIKDVNWIVLNNQQVGYYRVSYEGNLLKQISTALNTDVNSIDEMSRAQIIDDQLNLARAGRKDFVEVLNFLSFLKNDDSYYSWYSAFNGFDYLLQRTADEAVRNALMTYIKELTEALNTAVPIDLEKTDDQIYTLKQVLAATWSCKLGNTDCLNTASQQFLDYKNDATKKPSPNLRSIVYCHALQNSSNILEDFRFLWQKYLDTDLSTEKVTILKALGCANDEYTRRHYLTMALVEDNIRIQDARNVFSSVYSNSPEGVSEVLDFIADNYDRFITRFGFSTLNSLIHTVADLANTQGQIDKLTKFTETADLNEDVKNAALDALNKATPNLEVTKELQKTFKQYFKLENSGAPIGSYHFLNIIIMVSGYILTTFY